MHELLKSEAETSGVGAGAAARWTSGVGQELDGNKIKWSHKSSQAQKVEPYHGADACNPLCHSGDRAQLRTVACVEKDSLNQSASLLKAGIYRHGMTGFDISRLTT